MSSNAAQVALDDSTNGPKKTSAKRKANSSEGLTKRSKSSKKLKTQVETAERGVESSEEGESFDLNVSSGSDTDLEMERLDISGIVWLPRRY